MMTFFKFPNATYLTHTVFQQIQENLDRTAHLIDSKKSAANLADQYSLYLMLKILTANFKALSFCSISLPDIMDEETYQKFLAAYRSCIVRIIEGGFTQDFEEGEYYAEIKGLWNEIYQMSLNILSTSINLIYSNISDIVQSLETNLSNIVNEKQAENSSISLNYLTSSENAKKLLLGNSDELKLVTRVFEQCCSIKSQDITKIIKGSPLGGDTEAITPSNIVVSANKFIKSLSEQLIVSYCALSETLSNKTQVATSQNAERDEKDKQRIAEYEKLISIFYENASKAIVNQLQTMRSGL